MSVPQVNPTASVSQTDVSAPDALTSPDALQTLGTPGVGDVEKFNQILAEQVSGVTPSSANFLSEIGGRMMGFVDEIGYNNDKVHYGIANFSKLSQQQVVQLQESVTAFVLTTNILSKLVSTAAKQVDALTHIQ